MKTYTNTVKLLEKNPRTKPCEQTLKAHFFNIYYVNSHLIYIAFANKTKTISKLRKLMRQMKFYFLPYFFKKLFSSIITHSNLIWKTSK